MRGAPRCQSGGGQEAFPFLCTLLPPSGVTRSRTPCGVVSSSRPSFAEEPSGTRREAPLPHAGPWRPRPRAGRRRETRIGVASPLTCISLSGTLRGILGKIKVLRRFTQWEVNAGDSLSREVVRAKNTRWLGRARIESRLAGSARARRQSWPSGRPRKTRGGRGQRHLPSQAL